MKPDEETKRKMFRILSHAAMEKAKDDICKAVVPIYGQDACDRATHIGSSVLLRYAGMHLLATAAHVMDYRSSHKLLIATSTGQLTELKGDAIATSAPNGDRDLDRNDIAIVRLSDTIVCDLRDARYVEQAECSSSQILGRGNHCMVFGFPNSKNNDIDHAKRIIRVIRPAILTP